MTLALDSVTKAPQPQERNGLKGLLFIPAVRLTVLSLMCATALSACGPTYSPDTYASNAAQQAKVLVAH